VDERDDYGATATSLYEYLTAQDVYLGTKMATILYYAIRSETQELGREWDRADREAYVQLFLLVNNRILFRITHPKSPPEYFRSFNHAIENARIYKDLLVFNLYNIDNPDMVAEMADFLLRMEGIEIVLGMGHYNEVEILSLRTSSDNLDAGETMQKVLAGMGSAGGHIMTAGGRSGQCKRRGAQRKTLTRRLLEASVGSRCAPEACPFLRWPAPPSTHLCLPNPPSVDRRLATGV
jgi:nanoRNase/pAp phosphatase (c-di-AMP/oligoRNAs hydrolase)